MARQPLEGLCRLIFSRLDNHTFRHTTLSRTPLEEGPAHRRDLYLTTHNTHNRQTFKAPVGFKPTIPVSERPQTHTLDCRGYWDQQRNFTVFKYSNWPLLFFFSGDIWSSRGKWKCVKFWMEILEKNACNT
jgi:hypothetical protein